MNFYRLIISCLILFISFQTNAQKLEAGILLGITNYGGDVTNGYLDINETKPGAGVFLRYHFTEKFALRGGLSYGTVSGTDYHEVMQGKRNLHFRPIYWI